MPASRPTPAPVSRLVPEPRQTQIRYNTSSHKNSYVTYHRLDFTSPCPECNLDPAVLCKRSLAMILSSPRNLSCLSPVGKENLLRNQGDVYARIDPKSISVSAALNKITQLESRSVLSVTNTSGTWHDPPETEVQQGVVGTLRM